MPDSVGAALATPDLWWLSMGALLAGIVRGFSGFGTAMVYLPFAGAVLGPFEALTTLIVKDLVAPLILVPRALRDGQPSDVLRLGVGAALAVPLGVLALSMVEPVVFRWSVSVVSLVLLVLLATGLRYRGALTPPLVVGTGGLGGFLAGSVGLPGPPVIMLYMASTLPAAAIRANLTLYLMLADAIMLVVLAVAGLLVSSALLLGALMILPYGLGNWIGQAAFRPGRETLYRGAAYAVIAVSAIMGLPVWGG